MGNDDFDEKPGAVCGPQLSWVLENLWYGTFGGHLGKLEFNRIKNYFSKNKREAYLNDSFYHEHFYF